MPQVGLNGVDNGAIRFSGVRVPRENLLDRFGSVDSSGQYRSPYSASRRFAATLGELTGGRVGLTCSSLGILKVIILPSQGPKAQPYGPWQDICMAVWQATLAAGSSSRGAVTAGILGGHRMQTRSPEQFLACRPATPEAWERCRAR